MPSLFGGGGQTSQQKTLTNTENSIAQFGLSEAKQTIPEATSGLESSLNFFSTLLSGNQNAINSLEAPDIANINTQYHQAQKSTAEFSPRGGGSAALLEEAPFQKASSIAQLFTNARSTGATGVASIAQMLSQLGMGELGQSSSTSANTYSQLLASQQNQEQNQAAAGSAIGSLVALLATA